MPGRTRWRPLERALRDAGHAVVAGLDEVGRGPLAGPVVACAIVMPVEGRRLAGVDDSKRLSAAARAALCPRILGVAAAVGLGAASVREIDRLDIRRATALAMRRALARLAPAADHVLVDGLPVPELGDGQTAVVGGDGCCYSIACASIVAKEVRDRLMRRLAARHPAYAWERNAGYGTAAHLAALSAHGPTAHHRRTFAPVAQFALI